jgi:hypothetical protein
MSDPEKIVEALKRWQARYPSDSLRQIAWALMDVATAADRAALQASQSVAKPNHAREAAEAVRAYDRLRECVGRFNGELGQLRDGKWPEPKAPDA